jgi:hypothetical protein
LARDLAARALNAALREEWSIAAAIVRRLNADCGSEGTMTAVVGWCDTLATGLGLDGEHPVEVKFAARPGTRSAEPPLRIQWAAQLIMARARLDKTTFDALIGALPKNPAMVGSYVGAVLECAALTLKDAAKDVTP